MSETENQNILQFKNIYKYFPGVTALNGINLTIKKGETRVLLGENGAGKSSLVKVLCGLYKPEKGEMYFENELYQPHNSLTAIQKGIRVVYQEFNLMSFLSVAENIYFEKLPKKNGLVDYKTLYKNADAVLKEVGLDFSSKTRVEELGVAQMQLVEIAKAISADSKFLILDEPTATLTPKEIDRLFEIIKRLKKKGVTIIYISHRLQEIYDIGDSITVMRNGEVIDTCPIENISIPEIVKLMIGKDMDEEFPFFEDIKTGKDFFEVKDFSYIGSQSELSFSLKKGEILGISGLVGSGRTETMRAIFGADKKQNGIVKLHGKELNIKTPRDAVRNGIGFLTEDRKSQGLILDMTCSDNVTLTALDKISNRGLLKHSEEKKITENYIEDINVKTPSINQMVKNLSGGNQQKIVIAKWLFRNTELLIFDEPTRGIDVGAKYEIYLLLWELVREGKGIIVVSSDIPELMGICHRMLVFSNGKITGNYERKDFNQEKILASAYQGYIDNQVQGDN